MYLHHLSPHTCNLLTCHLWGISVNLQEGCQPATRLCGDNISLPFNGHRESKHICSRPIPDIISLLFFSPPIMSESTTKPTACPISLTNNPTWSQRLQNTELHWPRLKMSGIGQNPTWIDCAAFFVDSYLAKLNCQRLNVARSVPWLHHKSKSFTSSHDLSRTGFRCTAWKSIFSETHIPS